ncbi:transmembrane protein [Legionella quinlivanii]|uniref:Transmembrane protein n=1 Tax=Legionella quinlivanii TaxID=45073 RepID=A0A0W0XYS8_9GAMM|nr:beta-propeller fold lactonase family protein [Legionella quinlivanii]KTD49965.1 transmembrane protein [Legionella quinlivanii]MCW8450560.1 lactonase family protein [Legionella quinlivanii]SEF96303.1 Lactonase, 7-bladed beta-propeller [Legionella quinlivanii DSM 21216]STY11259.1 transmembrane protein [Legionella quinlivanii]
MGYADHEDHSGKTLQLMINNLFKKNFSGLFCFLLLTLGMATGHAKNYIEFIPLNSTVSELPRDSQIIIKYRLVNHSNTPRFLRMIPIKGITQLIHGKKSCDPQIALAEGEACVLSLEIDAAQLPESINSGPVLCEFDSRDNTKPSYCSQPLSRNTMLNLKVVSEDKALISVPPKGEYCYGKKNLTACSIQMTAASGVPATLTLFNNSTRVTASQIHAILPSNWTDVVQNASGCNVLPPQSSCTLYFLPGNTVHPPASVSIVGVNAATTAVTMSVVAPTQLNISVTGSPVVMRAGETKSLTITNNSALFPAFSIHSDFTGTALAGNVSETANNCAVVNPGASCTISFTAGTTTVAPTNFPVFGNNTIIVTANISIQSFYTYIPDGSGITQCTINAVTGQLGSCSNTLGFPPQLTSIAFNPVGTIAYIASQPANSVTQCDVTPVTGVLTNCANSGATAISLPQQITLNPAGTFAYIVNFSGGATKCTVNAPTGNLSGCVPSGAVVGFAPGGIAINSAGTRAYITSLGTDTISVCNINAGTGLLSGCVNSGATGLNGVRTLTFNSTETIAYITNQDTPSVSQCTVNGVTGQLLACANSGATALSTAFGIVLDDANEFAYISNPGNDTITKCSIDSLTGNLGSCVNAGATLITAPLYLAIN